MIELMLFFAMLKQSIRSIILLILFIGVGSISAQKSQPHSFIVNTNEGFID